MYKKQKGFTLIELVIVILLMSIISAVVVPVSINMVNSRKASNDRTFVKSLNTSLALDEANNLESNKTPSDALEALEKHGYTIEKEGVYWNEIENRFVVESDIDPNIDPHYYWMMSDHYDENNQKYSIYALKNFSTRNINNLKVSFDAGECVNPIDSITYIGSEEGQEVKIKTNVENNTSITINAPKDVVRHYGYAKDINIIATAEHSYHEYGVVENKVSLWNGRFILEKGSEVSKIFIAKENTTIGVTLFSLLQDMKFYGPYGDNIRYFRTQLVAHHTGIILKDNILAYIDLDGNVIFDEELSDDGDNILSELTDAQVFSLALNNSLNINGNVNGALRFNDHNIIINGILKAYINRYQQLSYDLDLVLSRNGYNTPLRFQYGEDLAGNNVHYVYIKDHIYKFYNADMGALFSFINGLESDISVPSSLLNLSKDTFKYSLDHMSSLRHEDSVNPYIEYQFSPIYLDPVDAIEFELKPIILRSDMDYNLTYIGISNLHDENHQLDLSISINANDLSSGVNALSYISNVSSDIDMNLSSLSLESRDALTNQLRDIVNNKTSGVNYSINVTRNDEEVFSTTGRLDLDVSNDNNKKVRISGDMVNDIIRPNLNTAYSLTYLNNNVYFDYQNRLKLKYTKAGIEELVDIFKTRIVGTSIAEKIGDNFFPDASTLDAPLFDIFDNNDYLSLLRYFDSFTKEGNYLYINFSSALIGGDEGFITFKVDIASNGLKEVTMNNIHVFGYDLVGTFSLTSYNPINISNESSYTPLDYSNNIITEALDLFDSKKVALSLNGYFKDKKGTVSFDGSTQFALDTNQDWGVGKVNITDKKGEEHHVIIDVTKEKVSDNATEAQKDQAFAASEILFNYYNSNPSKALKGRFTMNSFLDIYQNIYNLAHDGDIRFSKYEAILLSDISRSTITSVFRDRIEAILFDDAIQTISFNESTKQYTIAFNDKFIASEANVASHTYLYVNVKNNKLDSITFTSKLVDFEFSVTLSIANWNNNYTRLSKTDTYMDFSDSSVLVEYLLSTAKNNDYHVSGNLPLNINIFGSSALSVNYETLNCDAYVHIEEDSEGEEKVYSRISIDVPHKAFVNKRDWDKRTFNIYITDTEVYLETITVEKDGVIKNTAFTGESVYYTEKFVDRKLVWFHYEDWMKEEYHRQEYQYYNQTTDYEYLHMSIEDFFNDALYYFVNWGLNIDEGNDNLDFRGQTSVNDNICYSNIIKSFTYSLDSSYKPTWTAALSMEELTGDSNFENLNLTLKGNSSLSSNKVVNHLDADMLINLRSKLLHINYADIAIGINADMDNSKLSASIVNSLKSGIANAQSKTSSSNSYSYGVTEKVDIKVTSDIVYKTSWLYKI